MNIDKHVSLGRLYAASLSLERLPASSEMTAASVLIQDAARDVEALIDGQSAALTAAVQGEREAIKAHLDGDDFNPANGYDWTDERYEPWLEGVTDAIAYIDSRGPSPAVDVMAVVREYVESRRESEDCDTMTDVIGARYFKALATLRSLVAASPKAEGKTNV